MNNSKKISLESRAQRYASFDCVLYAAAFAASLIASQRFALPSLHVLACLVTFLLFFYYLLKKSSKKANACIILSLFLSVDIGSEFSGATPSIIRYSIYLSALALFLYQFRSNLPKIIACLGLFLVLLLISIYNLSQAPIDSQIVFRDLLLFLLLGIIFASSSKSVKAYEIDNRLLVYSIIAFMFGEIVNILFYYKFGMGYLSQDSTKALAALPVVFFLCRRNIPVLLGVSCISIWVLLFYQTRMILLSLAIAIVSLLLINLIRRKIFHIKITLITLIVSVIGIALISSDLGEFKLFNSLGFAFQERSFYEFLETLDPTRYAETKMFIERNPVEVLFGSGFGSGIYDEKNYLGFVRLTSTAFSPEELSSRWFYNFHDMHVDIGLRFGLPLVTFVLLIMLRGMYSRNKVLAYKGAALFILSTCTFFSTPGLILTTFFALSFKNTIIASKHTLNSLVLR